MVQNSRDAGVQRQYHSWGDRRRSFGNPWRVPLAELRGIVLEICVPSELFGLLQGPADCRRWWLPCRPVSLEIGSFHAICTWGRPGCTMTAGRAVANCRLLIKVPRTRENGARIGNSRPASVATHRCVEEWGRGAPASQVPPRPLSLAGVGRSRLSLESVRPAIINPHM
jgi:hypothetical protein